MTAGRSAWVLAALVLSVAVGASSAAREKHPAGFELLSGAEYAAELRARAAPAPDLILKSADPNSPRIQVVSPGQGAPVHPPVDIEISFKPSEGATVDPASLRILYGFLKLDVTRRILDAPGVQLSASGLKASGAQLPSGNHRLVIQLTDNLGRLGSNLLEFTVQ